MKTLQYIIILGFTLLFLSACSTSYVPYSYDDIYYSPSNGSARDFENRDNESTGTSQPYSNENVPKNSNERANGGSSNYYAEEQNISPSSNIPEVAFEHLDESSEVEYYDEDYAESLQSINSPVRSIESYDPYQRDRIIYTQDPFFTSPSVYGNYTFWDPFVPSTGLGVGWNSYTGWNAGVSVGFGVGYSTFGYGNSLCGRYYNPYQPYYAYNPFSPYGFNGYGNSYWNGYNNGFYQGYRNGYNDGFYNNNSFSNSNVFRTNTPRGNSGSPTARPTNQTRPTSGVQRNTVSNSNETKAGSQTNVPSRPVRNTQQRTNTEMPSQTNSPNTSDRPTRTYDLPGRNENAKTEEYNTPSNTVERPTRTPSYSQPRTNNPYSRPTEVAPQQQNTPQRTQPQQSSPQRQTRPTNTYERSRPSYNRSTPSYSPPTKNSGGGGSTPSRPTQQRRR